MLTNVCYSDRIEVEYKWLLVFDPINSQLPVPSEMAKPLPAELARKSRTTADDPSSDKPKLDQPFCDPQSSFIWSEFNTCHRIRNAAQVRVDLSKPKKLWFYIGKNSTEAKAQYTGDLSKQIHNPEANFLDTVKPVPPALPLPPPRRSYPASYPTGVNIHALNAARANSQYQQSSSQSKPHLQPQPKTQMPKERPYNGKYAITEPLPCPRVRPGYRVDAQSLHNQRVFAQSATAQMGQGYHGAQDYRAPAAQMSPPAPTAPMMGSVAQRPQTAQFSQYDNNHVSSTIS